MSRLMRADVSRMLKRRTLWTSCAILAAIAIFEVLVSYADMRKTGEPGYIDNYLFSVACLGVFLLAAFSSGFIGTEYSDGTMRNKITSGHSRKNIYLAKLFTSFISGMIMAAVYMLATLIFGGILLDEKAEPVILMIVKTAAMAFEYLAFSAIFTFISMLNRSRTRSSVICILLALVMTFAAIIAISTLEEPEFYESSQVLINGSVTETVKEPNPNYVPEGTLKRRILEGIKDDTPGGTSITIMSYNDRDISEMVISNMIWTAVLSAAGCFLFRRKDIY